MGKENYVIGMDFGTDSVRSIIVNAANGKELAASVFYYPRWKAGRFCDPSESRYRQHPLDYIEGIEYTVKDCLNLAGPEVAAAVRSISVDTTGSTPIAVDKTGTPLGLLPGFEENPNALFVLWKDHTSTREAAEINAHATRYPVNYLQYVGGIYSSEWFWAKLLHILRVDESIRTACYSWVEHCDWVPFLLTGGTDVHRMKRGVCSAGHKALWAAEFGGLPPDSFFTELDPLLGGYTTRLFKDTYTADQAAGTISAAWAKRLGLPADVLVGVGAFDAHMGAVGGQIEPYYLSKVMGTSTCDMLVAPKADLEGTLVKGICGQVDGSVIPGMIGLEAGQSAFGDVYAWWRDVLMWPLRYVLPKTNLIAGGEINALQEEVSARLIAALTDAAAALPLSENDPLALDWLNGRRTPDANQEVKAALVGLDLSSDAPRLFKAWVEATCFGAKAIVDRFREEGVPVRGLIGLGGVARKSPYIMQVMADVMDMPIRIHRSEQTCALGAAMFAATVAGIYPKVEDAMAAMGPGFDKEFKPDARRVPVYAKRYRRYQSLGATTL
ncbi:ribulokinase [Dinghuibacter silviterrae]|uniref:L-ribulokinase n=1 Tax=Dinghuibacter silviterrae TaxID=1539049 RepID=A0A4R8DIK7_9BACT|nr:ribulokinase [Dinghuibacter silviterrae]TDW97397.1 L-ribulokinase [Dinghuibacter silviterrae]